MNDVFAKRKKLKQKLNNRDLMFGAWVSFSHPSITEIFSKADFDMLFIDMEHSTISVEQGQRIISSSQSEGVPCIPRPVSHSNDYIKPLLDSGADGLLIQMVEKVSQVKELIKNIKYPPVGERTYGVNKAQSYGFDFDKYISNWNEDSTMMLQIESIEGVENIESLISFDEIDGVMIGPLDIAGSLGVPGQTKHPKVIEASIKVIEACNKRGISCGTQLAQTNEEDIRTLLDLGYNYVILGSDLFVLYDWAKNIDEKIKIFKNKKE